MSLQSKQFPSEFQHLALYTGNIMKTSVGGRNSVFHKKTNMEVSVLQSCIKQETLTLKNKDFRGNQ